MKPYPYAWMNSWNINFNGFYFISPRHPFLSLPAWTRRMGWRIAGKASNTTAGDSYVAGEATQGFALSTNQAKQASQQRLIQLLLGTFPGMGVLHMRIHLWNSKEGPTLRPQQQQESPEPISCCRFRGKGFTPPRFRPQLLCLLPTLTPLNHTSLLIILNTHYSIL